MTQYIEIDLNTIEVTLPDELPGTDPVAALYDAAEDRDDQLDVVFTDAICDAVGTALGYLLPAGTEFTVRVKQDPPPPPRRIIANIVSIPF